MLSTSPSCLLKRCLATSLRKRFGPHSLPTNALSRRHMQAKPHQTIVSTICSKRPLYMTDMPAAGDDLLEYLIVPHALPSPSSYPLSIQDTRSTLNPSSRPDTPRFHRCANRKAESGNMEIDYPTQPTPLTSTHADDGAASVPLEGVMSLDDFLSTHQVHHDALIAAREGAQAPPAKKPKTSNVLTPLQPVAVGARSSKYTILLHEKYQALAIPQPVFTFEGDGVSKFTVSVSFPGLNDAEELQGLKEEGRFNSKQEAKEAASKSALAVLERLVEEGRVTKAGKAKKPKGEPVQHLPKEKEDPGENYVGQLLEFHRATSRPQPTYTDYQLGTRWACLLEIEGHDQPFSSLDALFGSKKAARQHAAGCAVAHFKAEGLWPRDFTEVGGIKKRKVPVVNSPFPPADRHKVSVASTATTGGASATSQVAALAHLLSLNTPEYRFSYENSSIPDLHTVSCYFKNGGAHEGPIGEVRNVFGKKKAKEECARITLRYLNEVKKQREAVAARLIAGIAGEAGVATVGAGMAMDGEERVARKNAEAEVSDDDLDNYEDAMKY